MKNPTRHLMSTLLAGVTTILMACSTERSPLAPVAAAPAPEAGLASDFGQLVRNFGLMTCAPLPAATASKLIGPAGGTLQIGPHVFTVPAGALDRPVLITAHAASDYHNRIKFGPEGLQFAIPASLEMSYANCLGANVLVSKHIAYTTDLLQILEVLSSTDNLREHRVTAPVRHFSEYAMSW